MNETQRKDIGKRIQRIRKMRGESQVVLGKAIGCIATTVSKYERGELELYATIINIICERYQINHTWLLTGKGDVFADHPEKQPDFMSALMTTDDETVKQLKKLLKKLIDRL